MSLACNVCDGPLGDPVFRSARDASITSLSVVFPLPTVVYYCAACGHLKTPPLPDLGRYYAEAYRIHLESEEADQLYQGKGDGLVYRSEHQAAVLAEKVALPRGAKVLDYGCGKAPTMRRLKVQRPDLLPHLFDVSEAYVPFWQAFAEPGHWACFEPKAEWEGYFDAVTSFYALEHVADPRGALAAMRRLLKPGGQLYSIVPNWLTNIADVVVVDHVNHFWSGSYRHALEAAGFALESLDSEAHYGALVAVARKLGDAPAPPRAPAPPPPPPDELAAHEARVRETARYWRDIASRVRAFEQTEAAGRPAAIYGSGVYGNFIATCLASMDPVRCFLDQNPHQQGKTIMARPVVAPGDLPPDVGAVYVGLNPAIARREMEKLTIWRGRDLKLFFL